MNETCEKRCTIFNKFGMSTGRALRYSVSVEPGRVDANHTSAQCRQPCVASPAYAFATRWK
jgi:hypothetical protein